MGFQLVLPAGGSGSRIGGKSKQYRKLGDSAVLVQSIRPFVGQPDFDGLVVAVPADRLDLTRQLLVSTLGPGVNSVVVVGGATRQDSVRKALEAVSGRSELVLIHDAVRPFVTRELIRRVVDAASADGASCPGIPVADTLRRSAGDKFSDTVDREGLYRVQTPQAFSFEEIVRAHKLAHEQGLAATDDVELYTQFVGPVSVVAGSTRNFKITSPDDWETAEVLWPSFEKVR